MSSTISANINGSINASVFLGDGSQVTGITFSQLTDATITTPTAGQTLMYNGTKWANTTYISSLNTAGPTCAGVQNATINTSPILFYHRVGNIITGDFAVIIGVPNQSISSIVSVQIPNVTFANQYSAIGICNFIAPLANMTPSTSTGFAMAQAGTGNIQFTFGPTAATATNINGQLSANFQCILS